MAYTLETIHKYGYAPIGNLKDMIVEAITQLGALGKTRKEIAEVLNVSRSMVDTYVLKYDIPVTDRRTMPKKKLADRTVEEYLELTKTLNNAEICEEWDTNLVTLRQWRKEKGLMVGRRGNAQ